MDQLPPEDNSANTSQVTPPLPHLTPTNNTKAVLQIVFGFVFLVCAALLYLMLTGRTMLSRGMVAILAVVLFVFVAIAVLGRIVRAFYKPSGKDIATVQGATGKGVE